MNKKLSWEVGEISLIDICGVFSSVFGVDKEHLADARLLVSHLQKDLQTEKQDKAHIQKELNDTLAILNKPTAEMGTQTDLTAEQISQMERDLDQKSDELLTT